MMGTDTFGNKAKITKNPSLSFKNKKLGHL
jgi:hypothetical protein